MAVQVGTLPWGFLDYGRINGHLSRFITQAVYRESYMCYMGKDTPLRVTDVGHMDTLSTQDVRDMVISTPCRPLLLSFKRTRGDGHGGGNTYRVNLG